MLAAISAPSKKSIFSFANFRDKVGELHLGTGLHGILLDPTNPGEQDGFV